MSKSPAHERVTGFVAQATPGSLLELYGALAELSYPINDRVTFIETVRKRVAANEVDEVAADLFKRLFRASDFPLNSDLNALEKLNVKLPVGARIIADWAEPTLIDPPNPSPVSTDVAKEPRFPPGSSEAFGRAVCIRRCEERFALGVNEDDRGRSAAKAVTAVEQCKADCEAGAR